MNIDNTKQKMIQVGDSVTVEHANWKFSGETVNSFDEHIKKSIPLYEEGHELVSELSRFFVKPNSVVYEIGCSTGRLSIKLAQLNQCKENVMVIGMDIEDGMIDRAKKNAASEALPNLSFIHDDVLLVDMQPADFIVCYYTVQFIPPAVRQQAIDKLYKQLNWGGALVMFEKTRAPDARFQDIMSTLYLEYKLKQGYSSEEIVGKMLSLKGVLEPFSTQGNLDLLTRAGFVDITSVQKYLGFEGLLAIK